MKKIPWEAIENERFKAIIPSKRIGPHTLKIYRAVAELKATRARKSRAKLEHNRATAEEGFNEMVYTMRDSLQALNFSAFDDFARAWEKLEIDNKIYTCSDEKPPLTFEIWSIKGAPKAQIRLAIIDAVQVLQLRKERAPTRGEILDFLSYSSELSENVSIDDSELCRQLKKLGWQALLSSAGELAS